MNARMTLLVLAASVLMPRLSAAADEPQAPPPAAPAPPPAEAVPPTNLPDRKSVVWERV